MISGSEHVLINDEEAEFTALVERQSRFVFRVVYSVLLNSHDAEDAVQEVFLKLYRNRGWRRLDNERAFLARVAWRVAIDRRRATGNSCPAESLDSDSLPAALLDPPSPNPGPDQALLAAFDNAIIH